jgi:hypothetical protein
VGHTNQITAVGTYIVLGVDVGTRARQEGDDLGVATKRRHHHSCAAILRIHSSEYINSATAVALHRAEQSRAPRVRKMYVTALLQVLYLGSGVDIGAALHQQLHDVYVAVASGGDKGRPLVLHRANQILW